MTKGIYKSCKNCRKVFYLPLSRKDRLYCSRSCYYKVHKAKVGRCKFCNKEYRIGIDSVGNIYCSKKCSGLCPIRRKKMSNSRIGKTPWNKNVHSNINGKLHWNWHGGVTRPNKKLRKSLEYSLWRTAVFIRDNYTCIECGIKSGMGHAVILNADHIKPWSLYPNLRFDINNGRTLCVECHKQTDTYGGRINRERKNISWEQA